MIKAVSLDDGREVRFHVDRIGGKYSLTRLVLRRNRRTLGEMYRDEEDDLVPINPKMWHFDRKEEEVAITYYVEKYPDLGELDRTFVLLKGFAREVEEIDPLFDRAHELVAALNQRDAGPYVAVDEDGRVYAIDETAFEAVASAEWNGWKGWYSLARASDDTLWITPASNVRVEL